MPHYRRIITIERPVISRDAFGSEATNYETFAQVWADKSQTIGKERFVNDANRTVVTRSATFRINYIPGLNELMRVVDETRVVWDIQGIAVVGFNRSHDLICRSDGTRLPPPVDSSEAKAASPDPQEKQELPKPTRATT